jgi:hypothetical protein
MLMDPIPSSFILGKTSWSLPELQWAFENGVIGVQTVVDVASSMLASGSDSDQVIRLAGLTHHELPEAKEILKGNLVGEDINVIRAKWVWLVLSWVYEKHSDESSVFDTIDALYADFGYPEEMVPFGPYAPAYQAKSDPAEMREEVLREWRCYLDRGEDRFGRRA